MGLAKREVIERGIALGVDYATTYRCQLGLAVHCGRCPQCQKRREPFQQAGIDEPAVFYRT